MPAHCPAPAKRERFAEFPDVPAARLLALLLAQDGSTTRLCETVAGGPVEVHVAHQKVTADVPAIVLEQLPGERFFERVTSLVAHDEVLMDNLSFTTLAGLEPDIEADLLAGALPIGHLLARWWVRREARTGLGGLTERLWSFTGLPDAGATRGYRIVTPEAPRMLIVETYRRGMRMMRG